VASFITAVFQWRAGKFLSPLLASEPFKFHFFFIKFLLAIKHARTEKGEQPASNRSDQQGGIRTFSGPE